MRVMGLGRWPSACLYQSQRYRKTTQKIYSYNLELYVKRIPKIKIPVVIENIPPSKKTLTMLTCQSGQPQIPHPSLQSPRSHPRVVANNPFSPADGLPGPSDDSSRDPDGSCDGCRRKHDAPQKHSYSAPI